MDARIGSAPKAPAPLPAATMFPLFVQKMRQTLTFLATIENNHNGHENLGHYFDSGAAHDFRGSLYGPAFDKRSADHPKGELRPAFEAGPSFVGDTMLSVDQV